MYYNNPFMILGAYANLSDHLLPSSICSDNTTNKLGAVTASLHSFIDHEKSLLILNQPAMQSFNQVDCL